VRHDPQVRAYYEHLQARGKTKLQALVATMRKLLHAIYGMFMHDQPFDGCKFYAAPAAATPAPAPQPEEVPYL
jgi:CHAT domain-containing protein